jgi:hypothetical protein
MRNSALHRRLAKIEAKADQAAKAIEQERMLAEQRRISPEEAERIYREFTAPRPSTEASRKLSPHQALAKYLRLVRGSAPLQGKRR